LAPVLICLNRLTPPPKSQNRLKEAFLIRGTLDASFAAKPEQVGGETHRIGFPLDMFNVANWPVLRLIEVKRALIRNTK
jgi:hypothetical protein